MEWENKKVFVNFDYKTDEFITYLVNTDFVNPNADSQITKDSGASKQQLFLGGLLPVNEIIVTSRPTRIIMLNCSLLLMI